MIKNVAIASYNTSWLGDFGLMNPFASEKHLFVDQFTTKNPRQYFINAINNALNFWNGTDLPENVEAGAIGFQEMNIREYVKKITNPDKQEYLLNFPGGTDYIIDQFSKAKSITFKTGGAIQNAKYSKEENAIYRNGIVNKGISYAECAIIVNDPNIVPGLLILWKPAIFGNFKQQYVSDLNFEVEVSGKPSKQSGRPIMIVLTDKGYILINLHGPNFPSESRNRMQALRNNIQSHFNNAMTKFNLTTVNKEKIFIMGDFNDPYFAINESDSLIINDNSYSHGAKTKEDIKSCCYNFNSSCKELYYGKKYQTDDPLHENMKLMLQHDYDFDETKGDKVVYNDKECVLIDSNDPNRKQGPGIGPSITPRSMRERGKLENYRFTGDYVLGLKNNIRQQLKIYRSRNHDDGISHESDHEMVYAIFSLNQLPFERPNITFTNSRGMNNFSYGYRGKTGGRTKKRWSRKYKRSINCKRPKGFSQKQYCKYSRK